jgi:hypothetical protein
MPRRDNLNAIALIRGRYKLSWAQLYARTNGVISEPYFENLVRYPHHEDPPRFADELRQCLARLRRDFEGAAAAAEAPPPPPEPPEPSDGASPPRANFMDFIETLRDAMAVTFSTALLPDEFSCVREAGFTSVTLAKGGPHGA